MTERPDIVERLNQRHDTPCACEVGWDGCAHQKLNAAIDAIQERDATIDRLRELIKESVEARDQFDATCRYADSVRVQNAYAALREEANR